MAILSRRAFSFSSAIICRRSLHVSFLYSATAISSPLFPLAAADASSSSPRVFTRKNFAHDHTF
jgi:hypothetical protein